MKGESATVRATTTQAKLLTHSQLRTLSRIAPYIALAIAVTLLLGSQLAWVTLHIAFLDNGAISLENTFDMRVTGWSGLLDLLTPTPLIALARVTLFLWDVFPLTGIALCLILLVRPRVTRGLLVLYGAWLLLTSLICLLIFTHALTMPFPFPCALDDPACPQTQVVSRSVELGGWLALGSLALGWLALGMLSYRQRSIAVGPSLSAVPIEPARGYSPLHRLSAGAFTLGAVLWAVGLFTIPWATSGCAGLHLSLNHFVGATCSGVDGYDVLTAGLGARGSLSWPLIELASEVGLFVVIAFWLPHLPRATWMIALGWGLLVALMAVIGMRGIQVAITSAPHFTTNEGPWEASYGLVICALGVVICLLGAALLARDELRRTG